MMNGRGKDIGKGKGNKEKKMALSHKKVEKMKGGKEKQLCDKISIHK